MNRTLKETARGYAGPVLAFLSALAFVAYAHPVRAADLGGQCCSDLEERIADLEATTAKKGNRKVTLTVDGLIDGAYTYASIGDYHDGRITGSNGNDRSYVGFTGQAQFAPGWTAGFRLEIDVENLGIVGSKAIDSNGVSTRQSYWFVGNDRLGKVSLGKQATATNDLDEWGVSNAWMAGKPLSAGSLTDLYFSGLDVPFDGTYRNAIKYTSPTFEGFSLAAAWSDSFDGFSSSQNGNMYDVALRYSGEFAGFKAMGAAGYRHDTDLPVNLLGVATINLPTGNVDTFLVNGSVKHIATGIFAGVNYAHQDWSTYHFTLQGLDVTGGVEAKLIPFGATTLAGSWGRFQLDPDGSSGGNVDYYGLSIVQEIEPAVMDVFLGYRRYNLGDLNAPDADVFTVGARIAF